MRVFEGMDISIFKQKTPLQPLAGLVMWKNLDD